MTALVVLVLKEAALTRSPRMLRDLFVILLQTCAMSNPNRLWMIHQKDLSEDLLHASRLQQHNENLYYSPSIFNRALLLMEDQLRFMGGSELKNFGLPQPNRDNDTIPVDEILREKSYDVFELQRMLEDNECKMVRDQREAFDKVTKAIFCNSSGIFSLDAPGGTRKDCPLSFQAAFEHSTNGETYLQYFKGFWES